jgi:hypothetical protein
MKLRGKISFILGLVVSGKFTFIWLWEPSKGASGGLLMGFRDDIYDVDVCVTNRFFTRIVLMICN